MSSKQTTATVFGVAVVVSVTVSYIVVQTSVPSPAPVGSAEPTVSNDRLLAEVHKLNDGLERISRAVSQLQHAEQVKAHEEHVKKRADGNRGLVDYLFTTKARNAHSPYIDSGQLDKINKAGDSLGGEATGCNEATYGELKTSSISQMLGSLDPPLGKDDVLYDLGSGRGIVPVLALLEFGVKKAGGVEMADARVEMGCEALELLQGYLPRSLSHIPSKTLALTRGSMLDQDISDATVLFLCATCFRGALMRGVLMKALAVTQRTQRPIRIISVSEGFPVLADKDNPNVAALPQAVADRVHHVGVTYTVASWSNETVVHHTAVFPPQTEEGKVEEPPLKKLPVECELGVDAHHHAVYSGAFDHKKVRKSRPAEEQSTLFWAKKMKEKKENGN